MEGKCPTNCAFDPIGNWGLVITEAEKGQIVSVNSNYRGIILSLH
jgi:gluconolactonase